jgi:3-phosphoshikimate 1-carboxyvinyltransferase
VVNVLREMGADIHIAPEGVTARSSRRAGRVIDCNDFIDQFMLLAVVGALAEGETVLTNAEVCRHKECDRITEMYKALKAMGADVQERPDGLVVRGAAGRTLRAADVDSVGDHRIAMSAAVAGLVADGPTTVRDVGNVATSFPGFAALMAELGAEIA